MDWPTAVRAAETGEIVDTRGPLVFRVLEALPASGIVRYHVYDLETDIVRIQTVQDVTNIQSVVKELRNDDNYAKQGIKAEWMHAARIPETVIDQWRKEGLNIFSKDERDRREIKKRLNSSDWRHLRTGSQTL